MEIDQSLDPFTKLNSFRKNQKLSKMSLNNSSEERKPTESNFQLPAISRIKLEEYEGILQLLQ
jgi:hypothetical protein